MSIDKEFLNKYGMTKAEYKRVERQKAIEQAKENEAYMLEHGYYRGIHGTLQPAHTLEPRRKMKLSWRIKIRLHTWHLKIDPRFPLRRHKRRHKRTIRRQRSVRE